MKKTALAFLFSLFSAVNANAQALSVSPAGGGTPGGASLTVQYNNAGSLGGMSGTSWDDTNRSLTITGATVTASHPVLELSQTWNGAGVTFEALKLNVTNTASGGNSTLMTLSIGGTPVFRVFPSVIISSIALQSTGFSATADSGSLSIGAASDVRLTRKGAANLRLGAGDAAPPISQTVSVQGASGTNVAAAAAFTIEGPLATGNAAPGDIILKTGVVGASGATASTPATALTIKGATQAVEFAKNATFTEMTAPSAPTANGATLYCDDNGAGKTRCSILFATGIAQQIAIEP
jgi:hypothetical protein